MCLLTEAIRRYATPVFTTPSATVAICRIMTSLLIKMDVIRYPVSGGLNFRGTKLSRMAVEPRKPRKFSTAKIKVHTVVDEVGLNDCRNH